MFLAAELPSAVGGLATWQFLTAIVLGPALTIAVIVWTYTMNNRRSEQVKLELSTQIELLNGRVTEIKTDLGASIKDLKTDLGASIQDLKTDMNDLKATHRGDLAALRSDIKDAKSDIKDLMQSEMKRSFVELQAEILKSLPQNKAGSAGSGSAG